MEWEAWTLLLPREVLHGDDPSSSKKAVETFKGDTKKISQIIEELSYTAGQGDYFPDQHDKWWKKYL